MKENILYVTYDSLEDSISKSQILPLLKYLKKKQYKINLISFEKKKNNQRIKYVDNWEQIKFENSKILKILSILKCIFLMFRFIKHENVKIIHCRSYIPAIAAFFLKKILKFKYIFDIRGFWFDEKHDTGLISNIMYFFLKIIEKKIYKNADCILTLSYKSIKHISNLFGAKKNKINFVSCYTDTKIFIHTKKLLKEHIIFGYVGNVGLSYDFNKVLKFLNIYNDINPNWTLIFLNNHLDRNKINKLFYNFPYKNKIKIRRTNYYQMKNFYKNINLGIYFLKNSFAKIASCPTKLGEMLSCGIPIITNGGIGDIERYLNNEKKCGYVINKINKKKTKDIYWSIQKDYLLYQKNARLIALKYFEKNKNLKIYEKKYEQLSKL